MPYRRCPACRVTVHSVAGYSGTSACPVCGASLGADLKPGLGARGAIHRRLVREPVAAAAARRELEGLIGELDQTEFEVTALLMTELIANSVRHAGPAAGTHVGLDVAVLADRIRVEVRDGGPGFEPASGPDPEPGLHWGLHLVDSLASRWQVVAADDAGETLVWFELDRRRNSLS